MIEYVSEYILWVFAGILFLLILSLLTIRFFKQKSAQHPRKLYPPQGYTETISDSSMDSHLGTSQNTVDDFKCYASDLEPLLKVLTDEIQGIRESLNQTLEILQSQMPLDQPGDFESSLQEDEKVSTPYQGLKESLQLSESKTNEHTPPVPSHEIEEPLQTLQTELGEEISPALVEFCDLYNAGERYELQTRYQEHHRISVVNAMGRRRDLNQPLLFQNQTNGKFLVYYIEEENLYAVVPSYDLVLERLLYDSGAFGEVFDCPGFDPRYSYSVKLILPARFKPDYTKEKWTLEERGQLELIVRTE